MERHHHEEGTGWFLHDMKGDRLVFKIIIIGKDTSERRIGKGRSERDRLVPHGKAGGKGQAGLPSGAGDWMDYLKGKVEERASASLRRNE